MTAPLVNGHALELVEQVQAAKRKRRSPLRGYLVIDRRLIEDTWKNVPELVEKHATTFSFDARSDEEANETARKVIPESAFIHCEVKREEGKKP